MAILTFLRCPHCGAHYGSFQRTIRKESAPLAVKCGRCNMYVNLTRFALEWELLSDKQKILRYLSTGLVATVTGAGYSLLITTGLFMLLYICGLSAPNISTNLAILFFTPLFLIPFTLIAIVLVVWQYYRMLKADIEGSSRRLADPEYRQVLRALGKTLPAKYDQDF